MPNRLRVALVNPDWERPEEWVEMDETLVGGVKHGRTGKGMSGGKAGKFNVFGALEVRMGIHPDSGKPATGPMRLRLRHAPDLGAATPV